MAALYWLLITSSAEGSRFGFHTRALFFFLESPLMPCFRVMVTVITHIITSSVLLLDRNISRNAAKENIIIHHFSSKWTLNCLNSLRNLAQWISQKHSRAMNLLLQLPCSDSHLYFPGIVITLWLSHEVHLLSHLSLVTSEVHHQGVQVTGPPPLGPELHHRDVSLPLLKPRAVASTGAAPASLVTRGPQGEPGEGPPAVPVHWPAPGGPGAVGVVTPSVARLTWAYLEGLKLKWSDVDYSFIGHYR